MSMEPNKQRVVQGWIDSFYPTFKTIGIASVSSTGEPLSSYAPCVWWNKRLFILISETAPHFNNLKATQLVSAIFLQDESQTENLFFRKRLTLAANAKFYSVQEEVKQTFLTVHGAMVKTLLEQLNFNIVELVISKGLFVNGPGQAYRLDDKLRIIELETGLNNNGHQKT